MLNHLHAIRNFHLSEIFSRLVVTWVWISKNAGTQVPSLTSTAACDNIYCAYYSKTVKVVFMNINEKSEFRFVYVATRSKRDEK